MNEDKTIEAIVAFLCLAAFGLILLGLMVKDVING